MAMQAFASLTHKYRTKNNSFANEKHSSLFIARANQEVKKIYQIELKRSPLSNNMYSKYGREYIYLYVIHTSVICACTHVQILTHTHTHTHIYIYIYIEWNLLEVCTSM